MSPDQARALAEAAHAGQVEPTGAPLIAHVRRVAYASPPFARNVGWLHEILERTTIPEEELLEAGLSEDELRALRLLTRPVDYHQEEQGYIAHIKRILGSSGGAGTLARAVKRADLEDRLEHPRRPPGSASPPYGRALDLLAG